MAVLPRRADTTAVIAAALPASARGAGYRRTAGGIGRPTATVRRWVRAGRDADHLEWLRAQGVEWITRVDREVLATLPPESTHLGEALTALAAAAVRARLAPYVPPWTLIGQFTGGRLVAPGWDRLIRATLRVLARSQSAATMPTPIPATPRPRRHRDDKDATAPTSTARDARFTSASRVTPTSAP